VASVIFRLCRQLAKPGATGPRINRLTNSRLTNSVGHFFAVAHLDRRLANPEHSTEVTLRLVDSGGRGLTLEAIYRRYCR